MKFVFATSVFMSTLVQAQLPPLPEFIDQPYLWDRSVNTVLKLEEGAITVEMKMGKGLMYIGGGETAAVAIPSTTDFSFVMNMHNQEIPTGLELYTLGMNKGKRALVIKGPKSIEENKVLVNFKKLDGDLFEIVAARKLEPGEYAFFLGMKSYSFKVQ